MRIFRWWTNGIKGLSTRKVVVTFLRFRKNIWKFTWFTYKMPSTSVCTEMGFHSQIETYISPFHWVPILNNIHNNVINFCLCRPQSHMRSGGIYPLILNFGFIWRWVVSFTLRPFYVQEISFRYSLNSMFGLSQSPCGLHGDNKNSFVPKENRTTFPRLSNQ